ncbi:MAG: tripartite tricarboxylate transporter TctB family protein [Rhodoferax sp.]|uniref:tripartite tricarboxylate transporter TctB family protein n=1 Tax=Rhodoferax sp. TaxID=50421 RepID=UPI00260AAC2C|nr:tripartite tricarboxylate transporter TctB family protein [Rhodoferax sp.]MDD5333829.1 tripartite tricarboxylate transporter TctB family protein [Rhodoferax sp.]
MEQKQPNPQPTGWSFSAVDAIAAVVIFAVGVVMMVDNYKIGAGWASDGPESGYFPFRIGAILCFASLVVALRSLLGKQRKLEIFVSRERFKPVLLVLLPTAVYVLAIQFLGIYVASTLFIAAFMRVMDKSSWLKTLLVSLGVSVLLFWMFEIQFKVPLPKGPLEAWFGY